MIFVRQDIVDAIREHALNPKPNRPGREVVGVLVMRGEYASRYVPMRNRARGDNRFRVRQTDYPRKEEGEKHVLVHSHPITEPKPSKADHKGASFKWIGKPYGIFSIEEDRLAFWIMNSRKPGDHDPVELVVI